MSEKRFSNFFLGRKRTNWFFDFETYNIGNPEEPEAEENDVAVYSAGLLTQFKYYDWIGLDALDNFIDFIETEAKKHKSKFYLNLIAHNCFFDYHFFLERILERWPDADIHASFTADAKHWICAEIRSKKHNIDIKFTDTWRWDQTLSLACWARDILKLDDFQKLQLEEYNKWNLTSDGKYIYYNTNQKLNIPHEKRYLRRDVEILPKVFDHIEQLKLNILNYPIMPKQKKYNKQQVLAKITSSGISKTAMELYLGESLEQVFRTEVDIVTYVKMDCSFFGAFTSGNKNITNLELSEPIIESYDINNLYPSIMARGLPYGDLLLTKPKGEHVIVYEYKMTYCEWKPEYEFFTANFISSAQQEVMKKFRKMAETSPNKFVPTWYMYSDYYDLCKELCDTDIEIVQTYYMEVTHALDPFFEYLYEQRLKAKAEGRFRDEQEYKLIGNKAYGKLAEKTHSKRWNWNNLIKEYELIEQETVKSSLMTGLYVTTQGRIILLNAILAEIRQGNEFIYSDTDSIKIVRKHPPKFEISETKLGAWKHEFTGNGYSHPLKLKRWYLYNTLETNSETGEPKYKYASSGFDRRVIEALTHKERLLFFDKDINILVKGGKKIKKLRKCWKTQLFDIDIVTQDIKKPIDYICKKTEDGKWVIEKYGK